MQGAEIPFEVTEERRGRVPLYCYRTLTGVFIRERLGMLSALPTYPSAARALATLDGVQRCLGQRRAGGGPAAPPARAAPARRSSLAGGSVVAPVTGSE